MNAFHTADKIPYPALSLELSEYGLHPADWRITRERGRIFRISHVREPDFFFRGQITAETGRQRWETIQLAGI